MQPDLATLRDLAESLELPLLVALFPVTYQVEAQYLDDTPQQMFHEIAGTLKLRTLDLLPLRVTPVDEPGEALLQSRETRRGLGVNVVPGRVEMGHRRMADHVAHLDHIVHVLDVALGQLRDVAHAVGPGRELYERAEVLGGHDLARVDRPDLDLLAQRLDLAPRLRDRLPVRRRHHDRAIVLHVDRDAVLVLDRADRLPAGPDQLADLLRVDLDRDQTRRVDGDVRARTVDHPLHLVDDLQPPDARLLERPLDQLDVEKCCAAWPDEQGWLAAAREHFGDGEVADVAATEIRAKAGDRAALRRQLQRLRSVWPQLRRQLRKRIDVDDGGPLREVTPSPDGRRLAVVLTKDGGSQIYLINVDGSGVTRLTHSSGIDTEPNFSPDGRHIIFTSDRGGSPQIYRVPVAGGQPERLTFEGSYNVSPRHSPDGESFTFIAGGP